MAFENDSKGAVPDEIFLEVDIISNVHRLHSDLKIGRQLRERGTGVSGCSDGDKGCPI